MECGYWGSEEAGWADLATVDADEETLDFRVGRIEENPRVAFNSVIKKWETSNWKRLLSGRLGDGVAGPVTRNRPNLRVQPAVPVPVRTVNSRGTIWRRLEKNNKIK